MIPALRFETARRPAAALLLGLALASCADAPRTAAPAEALFADASFAPPTERIAAADIFQVSPEMRAYLQSRVAEEIKEHGEARGLVEALFMDRRLKLDYDAEYTRNAAQAFDARAGNCLSLAIVTGAMAREVGLDVRYQSVSTSEHWERDGDLLELVGHVNVSVGLPVPKVRTWGLDTTRWTVDFLPPSEMKGLDVRPISEARIAAMFMNNRAAEALAQRRTDDAYWWLRSGVAVDPSFAALYNTLGVTYLRKGLLPQAESALRFALSIAPDSPESWNNLSVVLRHEGQVEQAAALEAAHPRSRAAALAAAIDGGVRANEQGDYARALELLNRALRASRDNHQLHYLLAMTYLNLGDRRHAMEHLREAEEDSTTARQRSIYASKIELLKSTTSSFRLDPKVVQPN
ncbi:MAG TPA: tetratricopeptide repeat protein [Burkholderiaceae bacterium]